MKSLTILLLLPVLLFSFCSSKPGTESAATGSEEAKGAQKFKITGKITNFTGKEIILNEATPQGMRPIDTATLDEGGNYKLEGFLREKTLALINFGQYRNVFLVVDTTSKIKLDIDAGSLITYKVSGSDESAELKKMADLNTLYNKKIMDLDAELQANPMGGANKQAEIDAKVTALIAELQGKLSAEIATCKSPIAQIFAIEMMQVQADLKTEEKILADIKTLPANKWFEFYGSRASQRLATTIGATAPEISLKDTAGKVVNLSSLKGKYVMIDFWASWCKPCRQENPNVVRVYNTYKNKGFEIFAVSLDNNPASWQNAIKADGLQWIHVSDLGGWSSSAAKLYSITSIPQTVLLDKEGKIIAKGLRGAQLEEKLRTLLN